MVIAGLLGSGKATFSSYKAVPNGPSRAIVSAVTAGEGGNSFAGLKFPASGSRMA